MHMQPVANSMGHAENLTLALVLAPLAGLAAGFTRFFGKKRPDINQVENRTTVDNKDGAK